MSQDKLSEAILAALNSLRPLIDVATDHLCEELGEDELWDDHPVDELRCLGLENEQTLMDIAKELEIKIVFDRSNGTWKAGENPNAGSPKEINMIQKTPSQLGWEHGRIPNHPFLPDPDWGPQERAYYAAGFNTGVDSLILEKENLHV